tara:strand:- start:19 stop:825 length:807 start_codon:yes stop_codon:yes gene_type:complete
MKKPLYMTSNYDDTGSRDDYALNISSSLYTPQSGSTREIADRFGLINTDRRELNGEHYGSSKSYIWDAWGVTSDDVQFHTNGTGSGYYNRDFEFKIIGDIEIISSSFVTHSDGFDHSNLNYSDIHSFKNKTIIDIGKGFSHKAYTPTGSDINSVSETRFVDGRPIGRTHYFATSSTGDILYPPNHYIIAGTSKNSMGNNSDHMNSRGYVGSQHPIPPNFKIIEGGILNDPLSLVEASSSVDANDVVGASTDQAIVVVSQGGIQTGESG